MFASAKPKTREDTNRNIDQRLACVVSNHSGDRCRFPERHVSILYPLRFLQLKATRCGQISGTAKSSVEVPRSSHECVICPSRQSNKNKSTLTVCLLARALLLRAAICPHGEELNYRSRNGQARFCI